MKVENQALKVSSEQVNMRFWQSRSACMETQQQEHADEHGGRNLHAA